MPYRAWLLIAALGLSLSPSSGQAQEQAESGSRSAPAEQEPSPAPAFRIPVEIVEDHESADARQRREEESRQREIEDLAAQQGMNAATQAMNEATQAIATYSWYQTIAVCIGTGLLVITLLLTWSANRSARDAVAVTREVGKKQTRAYLTMAGATVEKGDSGSLKLTITVGNTGNSPAFVTVSEISLLLIDSNGGLYPYISLVESDGQSVGSRDTMVTFVPVKSEREPLDTFEFNIKVFVRYSDVFGDPDQLTAYLVSHRNGGSIQFAAANKDDEKIWQNPTITAWLRENAGLHPPNLRTRAALGAFDT